MEPKAALTAGTDPTLTAASFVTMTRPRGEYHGCSTATDCKQCTVEWGNGTTTDRVTPSRVLF
jgi:hypothetical protein